MATLTDEFKKLIKGERPDPKLLVLLLRWTSGKETNIENCQNVNYLFPYVNSKIITGLLTYNNKCKWFLKYPKVAKDDVKIKFFYDDICKYYGWTTRELKKNWNTLDFEYLKERIATAFAYDKKEIRALKNVPS